MRVTAVLLHCCFSAREEFQISCSCPYMRVSLGCKNVLILVSSSRRRCKLPFLCPLVDLFLRGVAKLKKLQDEVSYILVIHLEALIISVMVATMRRCLLHLANSRAQHKTGGSLTSMDVSAMLDRSPRRSLARASGRTTFPQVW